MSYINYSPWTDAGNYGQGLGQALGQAFVSMPQQRMALAAQLAQTRQSQEQEARRYALQERQVDQEGLLGQQKIGVLEKEAQNKELLWQRQLTEAEARANIATQKAEASRYLPTTHGVFDTQTQRYYTPPGVFGGNTLSVARDKEILNAPQITAQNAYTGAPTTAGVAGAPVSMPLKLSPEFRGTYDAGLGAALNRGIDFPTAQGLMSQTVQPNFVPTVENGTTNAMVARLLQSPVAQQVLQQWRALGGLDIPAGMGYKTNILSDLMSPATNVPAGGTNAIPWDQYLKQ